MSAEVRAEQAVAHAFASATDSGSALTAALRIMAEYHHGRLTAVWEQHPTEPYTLRCIAVWNQPGEALDAFAALTRSLTFRAGDGLPGLVWQTGKTAWIPDLTRGPLIPRRAEAAATAGLRAAVCFPLRTDRGAVGVAEVYAAAPAPNDPNLDVTVEILGVQLGQLVERRRAEEAGFTTTQRYRATLQGALDCIVTIDDESRIIEFNPAAERTFGYRGEDVVGLDMADLIVPPHLREQHRRGLRRHLEDEQKRVLDQRIEIEAMRSDGSVFPVELTITRINVPGSAVFTAYLRDITDRRRAEAELRASRARVIEAGDAARRQIERDLHDGAQQQLVAVAVGLRIARTRLEKGDHEAASELLAEAGDDLAEAITELRELARGIHPAVLVEGGLDPALRGLVQRSSVAARLVAVPDERLPAAVEAAAYFVVAEGLTNVARHAEAELVQVELSRVGTFLRVEIRDDGIGMARTAARDGTGLRGLADRLAVLEGHLRLETPSGGGTTLIAEMPCVS